MAKSEMGRGEGGYRSCILAAAVLLFFLHPVAVPQQTAPIRIGVVDDAILFFVYHRSTNPLLHQDLTEFGNRAAQAKMQGNQMLALRLRGQQMGLQALSESRQITDFTLAAVRRRTPEDVDRVMAGIEAFLPAVAAHASVQAIVPRLLWAPSSAMKVDVTDQVVDAFSPDADTRRMIRDLKIRLADSPVTC